MTTLHTYDNRLTAMKKMTVTELAKLYGISRQALYTRINKGDLSKGSDGLIDFSEAIRVLGEPQARKNNDNICKSIDSNKLTEVYIIKDRVDLLEKQLSLALKREEQALEREGFYQNQIETMQRLLEAPKPDNRQDKNNNEPPAQEDKKQENKVNLTPGVKEEKTKKRGFWSSLFSPND